MLGGVHPDSSRSSGMGHSMGDKLAMKGIMTTTRSSASANGAKPERPEHMPAGARRPKTSEGVMGSSQLSIDPKVAERAERTRVRCV
jgi:hypothetical protein